MYYAASLNGLPHVLESIAPCLRGAAARVQRIGTEWVLESSELQTCGTPDEAFVVADSLLSRIHSIFTVYLSLFTPLEIGSIICFDDTGKLVRRRVRARQDINVYSSAGVHELSTLVGPESLGTTILARTASDPAVAEALGLVQGRPLTWSQVYDVVEFLGGAAEIERNGFASRTTTRRVRRTANHHRHLGRQKANSLPPTPPSLAEAQAFAVDLLKKWLATRVQ